MALVPISANGLKHEQEARRRRAAKRTGVSPQRRRKGKEAVVEDLTTDEDEPARNSRGHTHNHLSLYGWQPGAPPPSTPALLLS